MQPRDRRHRSHLTLTVALAISIVGCDATGPKATERVVVERAAAPVALVSTPDGGFL